MRIEEHRIATDLGGIYAKTWRPDAAVSGLAPIVLLHDSLGCVELWRTFPQQLATATQRRVVAYDRLGFGRSDPHPSRLGRRFVHDEAGTGWRAVREGLRIDEFVVFGHSVGGGMAIACAADNDDCRALITESAQAFVEDRTTQGIRAAQRAFAEPGRRDRLQTYHGDKTAWVLGAWIDTWLAEDFADWNLDDVLRRVRCPALVLHGDQDEYGSTRHPERIAGLAGGGATVQVFPGCGHVPHREIPDRVLDTTVRWLGDLAR